jgi:hypothetical protein
MNCVIVGVMNDFLILKAGGTFDKFTLDKIFFAF